MLVVVLAATLRFWRLDEMEYKGDERWTYERAIQIPSRQPWPLVGMVASVGVPNPALSVLVFVGLAKIGSPPTPEGLDGRVVALNVGALALVFLLAEWLIGARDREAWRWGGALAAVSPIAILLQRKIWAQSTLPIFSMLFLVGWMRRDRKWGALLWGVIGACLGQIHMSGFFFAAAFVLWELLAGQRRQARPRTRWPWFVAGSAIGGIGIAVWIVGLVTGPASPTNQLISGSHPTGRVLAADLALLGRPSFWVNWFCDAGGLRLDYSLGPHYRAFLSGPIWFGHATGLVLAVTLASAGIVTVVTIPWLAGLARDMRSGTLSSRILTSGETAFTEGAALAVFGPLLMIVSESVPRHYLAVAYPLQWVWVSRLALQRRYGRPLLAALWVAQLAISLSYLGYIHAHHGADGGDYGRAYRWQVE